MKILICDRIEEGYAVLVSDDETVCRIPLSLLDDCSVKEGDAVRLSVTPDEAETLARNKRIHSLFDKLKKKGENS